VPWRVSSVFSSVLQFWKAHVRTPRRHNVLVHYQSFDQAQTARLTVEHLPSCFAGQSGSEIEALCGVVRVKDDRTKLCPHPGEPSWRTFSSASDADVEAIKALCVSVLRKSSPHADPETVRAEYCGEWSEVLLQRVEAVTDSGLFSRADDGQIVDGDAVADLRGRVLSDLRRAEAELSGASSTGSSAAALDMMDAHLMLSLFSAPPGGGGLRREVRRSVAAVEAERAEARAFARGVRGVQATPPRTVGESKAAESPPGAEGISRVAFEEEGSRPVEVVTQRLLIGLGDDGSPVLVNEHSWGHSDHRYHSASTLRQSGVSTTSGEWAHLAEPFPLAAGGSFDGLPDSIKALVRRALASV
jgi:hypothetical protein